MIEKSTPSTLWNKAKEIVADAIELPKAEREAFIQSRCRRVDHDTNPSLVREGGGGNTNASANTNDNAIDHALLNEVRSLLAFGGDTDSFVDKPPNFAGDTVGSRAQQRDWQNEKLGAWQLDREIGRGGMGMVYLAHRADGAYQQQAAIKLLRSGIGHGSDAKSIVRMQRERQALAALSHPNIARLLDGGNALDNTPYLVMEYIEGESIDTFCSSHELSISARIGLMVSVCAAVQSAHQRLVIHRDLKPSNVMVTADGTPKLLDFGVARLLESQDNEIEQTQSALLFTPRYASPEQVRGLPVSVATDIYGLGLLLYELLAGESPYERLSSNSTNAATNAAAVMQTVMGDALRKPSDVAQLHHPENVDALKGDLDTILLKACAKEVNERYATVADLSADLTRYLQSRPIAARKPTWGYVANKFVRRHGIGVALGAAAGVAIAAGFTGTVIQKNRAEVERLKAQASYNQVRKIANSFIFKYEEAIENLPNSRQVRQELVADGLKFLDNLSSDSALDPELAIEQGAGYRKLAFTLFNNRNAANLGDKAGSDAAHQKARKLLDYALPLQNRNANAFTLAAQMDNDEATTLTRSGNLNDAVKKFESAIANSEFAIKIAPTKGEAPFEKLVALLELTRVTTQLGQDTRPYFDRANLLVDDWASNNPNDTVGYSWRGMIVGLQHSYAVSKNNFTEAIVFSNQNVAAAEAAVKMKPQSVTYRRSLQTALNNNSYTLNQLKQYDDSILAIDRAINVGLELKLADPLSTDARTTLARSYYHRGRALLGLDQRKSAQQYFEQSAAEFREVDSKQLSPLFIRQRGETLLWLVKSSDANGDVANRKKCIAEFLANVEKFPEVFSKPPTTDWVLEIKKLKT